MAKLNLSGWEGEGEMVYIHIQLNPSSLPLSPGVALSFYLFPLETKVGGYSHLLKAPLPILKYDTKLSKGGKIDLIMKQISCTQTRLIIINCWRNCKRRS